MKKKAIQAIDKHGALMVFSIKNMTEPRSLWSVLHPRSQMRWEWDDEGDGKVFALWRLREELSRSRQVVYCKWYQGRATFFSQDVFTNLLSFLRVEQPLAKPSREILDALEMDSPLSTRQLKEIVGLQGKWLESAYNKSLKALWNQLLIVGFGEIDDSSFPSLAIGATQNIFEELWLKSQTISSAKAETFLRSRLGEDNKFFLFALKLKSRISS